MSHERGRKPPVMAVAAFAVLGLALAAQVNLKRHLSVGPRVDEARLEQVIKLYEAERAEGERLRAKLAQANAELDTARRAGLAQSLEEHQRRLDILARFAGLSPVQGPGVRVSISDSNAPVVSDLDQNPYTVHDQDLLLIINELWAAGAEAMEVNRQRLVADSEVRCSGPVINVNTVGLTPPFRILAIGDPDTLSGALTQLRGGIVDQLRNVGIEVKITKERNLVVNGLVREPAFRYARPARGIPVPAGEGS